MKVVTTGQRSAFATNSSITFACDEIGRTRARNLDDPLNTNDSSVQVAVPRQLKGVIRHRSHQPQENNPRMHRVGTAYAT